MHPDTTEQVPVIGYGPLGRAVTEALIASGYRVRVIQRSAPRAIPEGAAFSKADVMDTGALTATIGTAETVILAIGLPYEGKVWLRDWPRAMASVLSTCERLGARLVFGDNLYLYGPQDQPLTEDLPSVDYGMKPKARAEVTRLWQAAQSEGRVRTAAVRAPDFYGPGVAQSILGLTAFGNLAGGKAAQMIASVDQPHDVAHIRDFARALVTLAEAPDDAYGQAWHVPTAPTLTLRQHLEIGAAALGMAPKVSVLPLWLAPAVGFFVPFVREAAEMHFLFDRPYVVDHSKFADRFWSDTVSFEEGLPQAALSFRAKP